MKLVGVCTQICLKVCVCVFLLGANWLLFIVFAGLHIIYFSFLHFLMIVEKCKEIKAFTWNKSFYLKRSLWCCSFNCLFVYIYKEVSLIFLLVHVAWRYLTNTVFYPFSSEFSHFKALWPPLLHLQKLCKEVKLSITDKLCTLFV